MALRVFQHMDRLGVPERSLFYPRGYVARRRARQTAEAVHLLFLVLRERRPTALAELRDQRFAIYGDPVHGLTRWASRWHLQSRWVEEYALWLMFQWAYHYEQRDQLQFEPLRVPALRLHLRIPSTSAPTTLCDGHARRTSGRRVG